MSSQVKASVELPSQQESLNVSNRYIVSRKSLLINVKIKVTPVARNVAGTMHKVCRSVTHLNLNSCAVNVNVAWSYLIISKRCSKLK